MPKHENRPEMNRIHMLSISPKLCQAKDVEVLLDEEETKELRDLLAFWRQEKDIVVATIPLPDATLCSDIEPRPHLCGFLDAPGREAVINAGLWVHFVNGKRCVSWLADSANLKDTKFKIVDSVGLAPPLCTDDNIAAEVWPRPSKYLVQWLRPSVAPDSLSVARFEEKK